MSSALREARPVREGSRIAIIAPSSPFDRAAFDRGLVRLRARYDVKVDEAVFTKSGYLAGDDDRRANELLASIRDSSVDGIVAARGGYGVTRVLPRIPVDDVAKARTLLVGFSDITGLHSLWNRANVQSIHGPMVCSLGDEGDEGERRFTRWVTAVEGRGYDTITNLETVVRGTAVGRLVGGNLSVLCAMIGTKDALTVSESIVVLEDVGERPYRVDRMLTQLLNADFFRGAKGLVLGQFNESKAGVDGTTVDAVLRERLSSLTIPVAMNAPVGHVDENRPLPFGREVRLDANAGVLEL